MTTSRFKLARKLDRVKHNNQPTGYYGNLGNIR